jgi:hypothetical protein
MSPTLELKEYRMPRLSEIEENLKEWEERMGNPRST